jgi:hypothetical protein
VLQSIKERTSRNTFIHVFGKPVENPSCGGRVKKLHRAPKDPSEKLIMEPGGRSQCALRSRDKVVRAWRLGNSEQAQFLLMQVTTLQEVHSQS